MAETILPASIVEETRRRYLTYALSVITSPPCPTCATASSRCSGASSTRCITSCSSTPTADAAKCARIVGDVIGKYHPHGDVAVYDALVRMAQDWVMRVPLVDGQGNFGSVGRRSARPPIATPKRSSTAVADHLLVRMRQQTVPMRPNYNGECEEPVVLPAQFPNLLVNGAAGIAVGMATNIPPHNLGDVIKACVHLIENPRPPPPSCSTSSRGPTSPSAARSSPTAPPCARSTRRAPAASRCRGNGSSKSTARNGRSSSRRFPTASTRGRSKPRSASIIADAKLPQLLDLTNEIQRKGGPAHRPRHQAGRRSESGHGVSLQAHRACRRTSPST